MKYIPNKKLFNLFFYLLILSIPLTSVQLTFLSISPNTLLILVFSILLFINFILNGFTISSLVLKVSVITFLYFFVLLFRFDVYFSDFSVISSYLIKYLAFISIFIYFNYNDHYKTLIILLIVNLFIVSIGFGLVQFGIVDPVRTQNARAGFEEFRTTGILSNFGDITIINSIVFLLILFPKLFKNRFLYLFFILLTIFETFVVLFFSQSRNLLLSLIMALLFKFFILCLRIKNIFLKTFVYIMLMFVATVSLLYIPLDVIGNSDFYDTGRIIQYSRAFDRFFDNPIIGNGFGYYQYIYNSDWDVHNLFINSLQNTGLIGLVLLLMISIYPFIKLFKFLINRYKSLDVSLNLNYLEFYLISFFIVLLAVQFFPGHNSIVFWSYLGMFVSISLKNKYVI